MVGPGVPPSAIEANSMGNGMEGGVSEFLQFDGVAERRGSIVRLTAVDDNGFIEIATSDVSLDEGRVQVRQGASATSMGEPHTSDANARPNSTSLQGQCPSGITCCIGSVQLCCDDFRIIGTCKGAWGCAKTFTP